MALFGGSEEDLSIVIKAKDEASETFKKIDGNLKKMGGSFSAATAVSQKFALGIAGAAVAAGAFGVASVKAAADAQVQMAKFDAILKATKGSTDAARDAILKASAATVKLGFDDEEAAVSMAQLYQRTGSVTEAMKLNQLAMDLSRAKGIGLAEASKAIGMVMSGNARVLKEYGIEISDTLTPMQALAETQKKVAGQSEAFANTFQGQIEVFQQTFGNLMENIGTVLLPILTKILKSITPIIERFAEWATSTQNLTKWLKEHQLALTLVAGAIVGALVPAFIALAATVWAAVPAFIAAAIALAPFIIGGIIIAGIVAGIVWIVKHWDMIAAKAKEIWGAIVGTLKEAWEAIKMGLELYVSFWIGIIAKFLDWLFPNWQENFRLIAETTAKYWGILKENFALALGGIKSLWTIVWGGIRDFFLSIWGPIKDAVSSAVAYIMEKIQKALDLYNKIKDVITAPARAVSGLVSGAASSAAAGASSFFSSALSRGQGITGFEKGGVVPGPEGVAVPIMAHGGERITPARFSGEDSGAVVLNFHFHDAVAGDDGIKRIIQETIEKINRGASLRSIAGA